MIAIKTSMFDLPEYCDCCRYYQCSPHPTKGWSDVCGLCYECMDDECKEGWLYDGDSRPEKCPLFIVPEERTCTFTDNWNDPDLPLPTCSACGWEAEETDCVCVIGGPMFEYGGKFCKECGAKVLR